MNIQEMMRAIRKLQADYLTMLGIVEELNKQIGTLNAEMALEKAKTHAKRPYTRKRDEGEVVREV